MTRDELDAAIDGALKSFSSHSDREVTLARLLRAALAVVDEAKRNPRAASIEMIDAFIAFDAALASETPESPPRAGGEERKERPCRLTLKLLV